MNHEENKNRRATSGLILILLACLVLFFVGSLIMDLEWLALLAFVCIVILILIGITTQTWNRLGVTEKLNEQLIENVIHRLFTNRLMNYSEYLIFREQDLDVKGLTTQSIYSLELEEIFVDLKLITKPIHQISRTPIPQNPRVFNSDRVNTISQEVNKKDEGQIWDYLDLYDRIAIIGPPGCGKTTLLKHVTLVYAQQNSGGKAFFQSMSLFKFNYRVPILLYIRDHVEFICETKKPAKSLTLNKRYRTMIAINLTKSFNKDELKTLCFDIGVDFENFSSGNKKEVFVRELITYCERYGNIFELVEKASHLRPLIDWPEFKGVNLVSSLPKVKEEYSIADAAYRIYSKLWKDDGLSLEWFENQLKKNNALIMFDGLDEVADINTRRCVVKWAEQEMMKYSGNKFIITSRPFGYSNNPIKGVTTLEIRPFDIKKIKQFIRKWYLANEMNNRHGKIDAGVKMKAQKGAENLIERLARKPVLYELAANPLLLTMIATVHRYRSSLPGSRSELYAEICDAFLGKRQQAKGLALELNPSQKQLVLQPLAYHMMLNEIREIEIDRAMNIIQKPLESVHPKGKVEDFLKFIEDQSGLLVESDIGIYRFSHLTFQEYLAAVHIKDNNLEEELIKHIEESWWSETIRLYAARFDATNIIMACLPQNSSELPSVHNLTLAIQCLGEARKVDPVWRSKLNNISSDWLEHEDPELREVMALALLSIRLKELIYIDEEKLIDNDLILHAEYQLFLDEFESRGEFYHPQHWEKAKFSKDTGNDPVLGVQPLEVLAFCDWLTEREASNWIYYVPTVLECAEVNLISEDCFWVKKEDSLELATPRELKPAVSNDQLFEYITLDTSGILLRESLKEIGLRSVFHEAYQEVSRQDLRFDNLFKNTVRDSDKLSDNLKVIQNEIGNRLKQIREKLDLLKEEIAERHVEKRIVELDLNQDKKKSSAINFQMSQLPEDIARTMNQVSEIENSIEFQSLQLNIKDLSYLHSLSKHELEQTKKNLNETQSTHDYYLELVQSFSTFQRLWKRKDYLQASENCQNSTNKLNEIQIQYNQVLFHSSDLKSQLASLETLQTKKSKEINEGRQKLEKLDRSQIALYSEFTSLTQRINKNEAKFIKLNQELEELNKNNRNLTAEWNTVHRLNNDLSDIVNEVRNSIYDLKKDFVKNGKIKCRIKCFVAFLENMKSINLLLDKLQRNTLIMASPIPSTGKIVETITRNLNYIEIFNNILDDRRNKIKYLNLDNTIARLSSADYKNIKLGRGLLRAISCYQEWLHTDLISDRLYLAMSCIRLSSLALASNHIREFCDSHAGANRERLLGIKFMSNRESNGQDEWIHVVLDLYVNMVLLEERNLGNSLPIEGLRIAKKTNS